MTRILLLALAVIFVAAQANAEAFDCAHPSPAIARIVCGDPALHAADQAESDAFDLTLLATLDRASLREEERLWFQQEILTAQWYVQHGMKVDPAKLLQSYQARAAALRDTERRWRQLRRPIAAEQLGRACLPLPGSSASSDCRVDDSGTVAGEASWRYQRQSGTPQTPDSAVIVFAANDTASSEWVPIAAADNAHARFDAPQVIDSRYGMLMLLTGTADGSGEGDVSSLYRFAGTTLEDVDDRSWLETLKSRLPDGLILGPGIVADYGKMTAVATIARSDSTCCPVGDRAVIALAIDGDRVVVQDISFQGP